MVSVNGASKASFRGVEGKTGGIKSKVPGVGGYMGKVSLTMILQVPDKGWCAGGG